MMEFESGEMLSPNESGEYTPCNDVQVSLSKV